MNILLVNHYAGSPEMGMEYRPYYLSREWINMGHKVTIIAADFSHLRKKNVKIKSRFKEEKIDGINYVWIKTPEYSGNGINRVLNIFSFVRKTMRMAKYFAENYKPDAVIASSTYPSDNYVAKKIAKLSNAKHIYEVHDLWPLSPKELGNMSKYHPFILAMQHAENYAYKHADLVISMLPNTKQHMKEHGLDLEKWHYVPNGICTKEWENPDKMPAELASMIKKLKQDKQFILAYTGGHGPSNALHNLVKAAEELQDNNDICFLLVGDGILKKDLMLQAKKLKNVIFFDPIPKAAIPDLLQNIDLACFGTNKSKLYKYGISMNKMMDYMMAAKPVIQYIDTDYDIIQKAGAGMTVGSEDPKALANAILKMKRMPSEELKKAGLNGKKYVLENHDYKILAKKYIDIMTRQTDN